MSSLQLFFTLMAVLAVLLLLVPVISRARASRGSNHHVAEYIESSGSVDAEVEHGLSGGLPPESLAQPRLRDRLSFARSGFSGYLGSILSRSEITGETWADLEEALIRSDAGVAVASALIEATRDRVKRESINDPAALLAALKSEIEASMSGFDRSLSEAEDGMTVWLFVGVNGVGKTTTIGKLANRMRVAGNSVMLAAGDTFRAAAAEQLETWANRTGSEIVRGADGADPSSVIFDAVAAAEARGSDIVLADTAGRLHTKTNLMSELSKVRRVAEKGSGRVKEILLVIDATTGQNGLVQAQQFAEAVDVTGVVLTKLDGSAKGGIVLAIQSQLGIPVKLVGVGEQLEDLIDFDPHEFVEALLAR